MIIQALCIYRINVDFPYSSFVHMKFFSSSDKQFFVPIGIRATETYNTLQLRASSYGYHGKNVELTVCIRAGKILRTSAINQMEATIIWVSC